MDNFVTASIIPKFKRHSAIVVGVGLVFCTYLPFSVLAKNTDIFTQYSLELSFNLTQPVLVVNLSPLPGNELVVIGMDEQQRRIVGIYAFKQATDTFIELDKFTLPDNIFAYDFGELQQDGLQHLYFLDKSAVSRYVPAHLSHPSKLIEAEQVKSMYLSDRAQSLKQIDFVQDLNNDGMDDIILPDFEHLNLWLSDCCGARHAQSLPIAARLEINESSVNYDDQDIYFADMNGDKQTDLVIVEQGKLKVFEQNSNKQFTPLPKDIPINKAIYGLNWWDMRGPNDQEMDQSNIKHRKVKGIEDFNADGIPDLAVEFTNSAGVLDKTIDYEFFYGEFKQGKLRFSEQASTSITSDDTLSNLSFLDINMDGRKEVAVSSFDIGISQIVSALLSGSIDQDVLIFSMDGNNQFSKTPTVSQEVEITFSLTSGTRGQPLVKMVDVNGDNFKDIVFSDSDDVIRTLLATPNNAKAYARRSLKQKVALPKNPSDATAQDINGDNKTDLILHYGSADNAENLKRLLVLMAN